jgi:hypothetical protein
VGQPQQQGDSFDVKDKGEFENSVTLTQNLAKDLESEIDNLKASVQLIQGKGNWADEFANVKNHIVRDGLLAHSAVEEMKTALARAYQGYLDSDKSANVAFQGVAPSATTSTAGGSGLVDTLNS